MFNPEKFLGVQDNQVIPTRIPRRLFIASSSAVISSLLLAQVALAEEWEGVSAVPVQPREYFPLYPDVAKKLGMHTLYEPNGPLDIYDRRSAEAGVPTNFRQKAEEDLAKWYFRAYKDLNQVLKDTSGFCHGVANAIAYGETDDPGDYIKLGQLAALHSGDAMYQPGIEQLMVDLATKGRLFLIETKGVDGFWTRIAWAVNRKRTLIKVTDFNRPTRVILPGQVQNAYFPVPEGEEQNFPQGTVNPAIANPEFLERLTFRLNRGLIG